jgi:type IV pilus assembly protein PilM
MARTRTRTLVGLDIEPTYLAAAEVTVNGTLAIRRAVIKRLEPGIVREGEVTDPELLGDALRVFWKEHKLPKRVRLGMANQRIVVRTIDMPPLPDGKELETALRFQAQDHIPMPLEQAVLDFTSLGVVATPEGQRTRVVLVAARRDMVERLVTTARAAGLRPEGVDLSAFAMVRALGADAPPEAAVLYLAVGGIANLAVAVDRVCLFTRALPGGLEASAAVLAERRELTLDHARAWLVHVGLEAPLEAIEGDPEVVADARGALQEGVHRLADGVRNSMDFYSAQPEAPPASSVILTGPALAVPGMADALGSELGLPVTPGTVPEAQDGAIARDAEYCVAVAAGLAVEEAQR